MKTTSRGVRFIARREAAVLVAYQDGTGHSIGFGRFGASPDATCTIEEAFTWLREDIADREKQLTAMLKAPVLDCMWDALISLLFNWGAGNMRRHPELLLALNAGQYGRAADIITTVKNGTPGLMKRRLAEREMFLNADYGDLTTFKLWRSNPRETQPETVAFPEEA